MNDPDSALNRNEHILEGIPASGGIAIGQAVLLLEEKEEAQIDHGDLSEEDIAIEMDRFHAAIDHADGVLANIEEMARNEVSERADIFEALRMILHDPVLIEAIEERITIERVDARTSIRAEMGILADRFSASNDGTMRSRAEDMRALQGHLLSSLARAPVEHSFQPGAILVLSSLLPSDTLLYARNGATAFVVRAGGINSHSAILARALGVPMVAGVHDLETSVHHHDPLIVDGYTGSVMIHPTETTLDGCRARKQELEQQRTALTALRHLPPETVDGVRICIGVNLDMIEELERGVEMGAEDVGLMRTEYLVMGRNSDIGVDEQLEYYRRIVERAYPLPVTLRAFDIGSEKLTGESWGHSSPLGLRGCRLLLARPEILSRQIEAALRASTTKNLRLMLPMVTSVEEIRRVRSVVKEVCHRLRSADIPFDENLPIGAMIETPAAALISDALAIECDFLSIGSNDLVQYTLAIDRSDDSLADYYDEFHPAILRLLRMCALAAARRDVPLTLCGELAARENATELLVGLGLRRFSVSPHELAPLKQRVRSVNAANARELARMAVRMATGDEVREMIQQR